MATKAPTDDSTINTTSVPHKCLRWSPRRKHNSRVEDDTFLLARPTPPLNIVQPTIRDRVLMLLGIVPCRTGEDEVGQPRDEDHRQEGQPEDEDLFHLQNSAFGMVELEQVCCVFVLLGVWSERVDGRFGVLFLLVVAS